MSRIGKQAVIVPSSVKVENNGNLVRVVGPKGDLSFSLQDGVSVSIDEGAVRVSCFGKSKQARANFGTTRALINNMVNGVTKGWSKKLILSGVGYNAKTSGSVLTLNVGYSHEVNIDIPSSIVCKATGTTVEVEGCDRELVGTIAAKIRDVAPPEPYLGKGIRYDNETVRRKAGKTGKGK
jgi:large subunit ribosomal protein L6